jgi:hypothetical protein
MPEYNKGLSGNLGLKLKKKHAKLFSLFTVIRKMYLGKYVPVISDENIQNSKHRCFWSQAKRWLLELLKLIIFPFPAQNRPHYFQSVPMIINDSIF